MSTDATRCAVCGGEFSARRIVIEGQPYHESCAVASYPPHTHEDMARLGDRIWKLWEAAMKFEHGLSEYCDGQERDELRAVLAATYGEETLAAHRAKL